MNITVAVTVEDLAIYALDTLRAEEDAITVLEKANKREIFALARWSIENHGRITAGETVPQTYTAEQIQRAQELVAAQYPELG